MDTDIKPKSASTGHKGDFDLCAMPGELPYTYRSLSEFCSKHGIRLGKETLGQWHLTERVIGHINGIPTSHGVLTATDGIMCYIEQANGLFRGHIGWFIVEEDVDRVKVAKEVKSPKATKLTKELVIYDLD